MFYGLKSSGKRWAEALHDILKDMDFIPSRPGPCTWLRKILKLNLCEYIAVYIDDLCIAAQNPKELINILKSKYQLKVKGDGRLTYYKGADYYHNPDGTMVCQPKKSIERLRETYIRPFNTEPSKGPKTPLEKNDHPELDTTDIIEGQQVNHQVPEGADDEMEIVFMDDPEPASTDTGDDNHNDLFGLPDPEQYGHGKWCKRPNHHLFDERLWTTYSRFQRGSSHLKQKVVREQLNAQFLLSRHCH